jgi:CO/xanthine dehydrogenase Mo-binding subunit
VAGRTAFLRDFDVAGRLIGGVLRSPHAHARIARLDTSLALDVPGVRAVIAAQDIPGSNVVPVIQTDWPVLAGEYVRHVGEAVALVAAETEEALSEGLRSISVDYEALAATLDVEAALASGEVVSQVRLKRGEAQVALGQSDLVVVEGTYLTPYQDHADLEPLGVLALPDGSGGLVIVCASETPAAVQRAVGTALGFTLNRVRIVQSAAGGSSRKEETPALLGAQAALLAQATSRPVSLLLSREDDMRVTTKRHPARIRCRTGATRDGHLIAAEVDLLLDGGAYATLSPLVLQRAAQSACGPYRIPNVSVNAKVVRTHKVPGGAFRGSGEAQVAFAAEGQMDLLSQALGLDPLELRLRNGLAPGDSLATGRRLGGGVGLRDVLERVATSSDWDRKRALFGQDEGVVRRGIGIATAHSGLHPTGRAGGVVAVSLGVSADGSVTLSAGRGELGQGLGAAIAQAAAEALRCPPELVRVLDADTSRVPDSSGWLTPAGLLVEAARDAGRRIRAAMDGVTADAGFGWREGVEACLRRRVPLAAFGFASAPDVPEGTDAEVSGTFSATVAEIEVDSETGETRVLRVFSAHDAGRVQDAARAEGQIEGGVVQGLGFALLEGQRLHEGELLKGDLTSYRVPTSEDAPEVHSLLVETVGEGSVPDGTKDLGEAALISLPGAVASGIQNALGVRLLELPLSPEGVRDALLAKRGGR